MALKGHEQPRSPRIAQLIKTQQLAARIRALVHGSWWVEVDRDILRQVLRSGTSVGANYREACYAESPSDFIHKLKLVRKEVAEVRARISDLTLR